MTLAGVVPKVKVFSLLEMTQKLRLNETTEATKIKKYHRVVFAFIRNSSVVKQARNKI